MLQQLIPILAQMDEGALMALDQRLAAAAGVPVGLLGSQHTISWALGKLEANGPNIVIAPSQAKAICDILAAYLGPDHCQNAVTNEGV